MCLGVCARGTSQAPACFASIIHQARLKAGETEQCLSLPQHFPPFCILFSAFGKLCRSCRCRARGMLQGWPGCFIVAKKGQKIRHIRPHCWVFAKWRHSPAMKYTPSVFKSKLSSGLHVVRVCFAPSCRMHSPPSLPRVAAQEPAHSRHTAGSRIIVARPPLILGCPALASGARSDQISAPKSRTAAFSCGASRTRFHRVSHSSEEKTPLHRPNPQERT